MSDWLSTTWEANWRSFQYYNAYRLLMAVLFVLAVLLPHEFLARIELGETHSLIGLALAYLSTVVLALAFSLHWQHRFNLQLSIQVVVDALVVSAFSLAAGGVASGYGILQVVSLAGACLVGRGRLVLFYAAISAIATLLSQVWGISAGRFDVATLLPTGLLSAGFFATAILARLLGQHVMSNEELARRRGEELANQSLISQRIVERMQDGMLVIDRAGGLVRHNPVAGTMLGLPPEGPCRLSDHVPLLAEACEDWRRGARDGAFSLPLPDGHTLRVRIESTHSSDGEILVFLEDMAQVKAQAQQLKLAALGRLTASIAHEIRNPLSAIRHASDLLREDAQTDMQHRLLRIVGDNVARLDRIVSDVLELGRQSRMDVTEIELGAFCQQFLDQLPADVAHERLALDCPAPAILRFDRAQLQQVLWNLVANALRHASAQVGAVRLLVRHVDGWAELHVLDDGPGIPPESREQIFEPFYTTHTQGTGLGLFIARELCVANGARLTLGDGALGGHFIIAGEART